MDMTTMFAVLIAGLLECSDIEGIIETVRSDKNLSSETKTELVEILLQGTPQCELNERSKDT
jgi:hypothetical protein|tara:strand:- start:564 stop:749 length:186 start_codon:yes stop_codon:yes gene_type:complete